MQHLPRQWPVQPTIDSIAAPLQGGQRIAFYREAGQALRGQELDEVLERWWYVAVAAAAPDRDAYRRTVAAHLAAQPDRRSLGEVESEIRSACE